MCCEGKIYVGMEFNLITTADKLLLLLMVAAIMRHSIIIVTSNNTVIRWQRMKIWGHRRQVWKRRPQSNTEQLYWSLGPATPIHPISHFLTAVSFLRQFTTLSVTVLSCSYLMGKLNLKLLHRHGMEVPGNPRSTCYPFGGGTSRLTGKLALTQAPGSAESTEAHSREHANLFSPSAPCLSPASKWCSKVQQGS